MSIEKTAIAIVALVSVLVVAATGLLARRVISIRHAKSISQRAEHHYSRPEATVAPGDVSQHHHGSVSPLGDGGFVGVVVPSATFEVYSKTAGVLTRLSTYEGATLKPGQVFAELQPDGTLLRELAEANAALGTAQTDLERAEVEVNRLQQKAKRTALLRTEGLTSSEILEETQTELAKAEIDVVAATNSMEAKRIARSRAEEMIKDCRIIAPIHASVSQVFVEPGMYIPAGTRLLSLVSETLLRVRFAVEVDRLPGVSVGAGTHIELPDGRAFMSKVDRVPPDIEPSSNVKFVESPLPAHVGGTKVEIGTSVKVYIH